MKQITIKCPPGFELGSDVYVIPCFLGNKDITKYKILDFHYSSLGCGTLLAIDKKQKGLENLIRLGFENYYKLAFPTMEQAAAVLEKLKEVQQGGEKC